MGARDGTMEPMGCEGVAGVSGYHGMAKAGFYLETFEW
jgi:hypothetical protein